MQKSLFRKGLVLGIIALFIGVGIQPVFAVETKTSIMNKGSVEDCTNCQVDSNLYRVRLEKLLDRLESYIKILGILYKDNPEIVSVCNKNLELINSNIFDELCDSLLTYLSDLLDTLAHIPHTKWYSALVIIAMMGVVAYSLTFVSVICGVE